MNKIFRPVGFLLFPVFNLAAQNIPIGQWRDHLPYANAIAVADAGDRVYCASASSLFYYDKNDKTFETLSKVQGLSDVGINAIRYSEKYSALVIAYSNANIDILEGNQITNMSDIKKKNMIGEKNINSVMFIDKYAILSCSFGLVSLDIVKKEIKETYYLGPNGDPINVNESCYDGIGLYAATDKGVYKADYANSNLSDFNSWSKEPGLPDGIYNEADILGGKPVVNYFSGWYYSNLDRLYIFNDTSWKFFLDYNDTSIISGTVVSSLETTDTLALVAWRGGVTGYNLEGKQVKFSGQLWTYETPDMVYAVIDRQGVYWFADWGNGLIKNPAEYNYEVITPIGPPSKNVYSLVSNEGMLWVAPGGRTAQNNNTWNGDGIFYFIDGKWKVINYTGVDSTFDIVNVAVDPANKEHFFAGSWGKGILEFENFSLKKFHDETNSSNQSVLPGANAVRITSLAFDKYNNLWATTFLVKELIGNPRPVSVYYGNDQWQSFELKGSPGIATGNLMIDSNNVKWIPVNGYGIIAFDENGTIEDLTDDRYRYFTTGTGYGNLPSIPVHTVAVDLSGDVWVGTDKGVAVFYSPSQVFDNQTYDATQILVFKGGYWQYLLESEAVKVIAVDGANRKWVGTRSAGVFLLSKDGTEEIFHFTSDNSPVPSNEITSIAIDRQNGEVFIGTTEGMVSYRSSATTGGTDFSDAFVFPNPVRESYEGTIAISGLISDSNVKITDISGNLIYETVSEGGTATWNGKNFTGRKANTGVYLVFCSGPDGSQTLVTKILFIN